MARTASVLAGKGKVTASFMLDSTSEATIPELRERLDKDGYLLIRQFLSAPDIEKVSTGLDVAILQQHRKALP